MGHGDAVVPVTGAAPLPLATPSQGGRVPPQGFTGRGCKAPLWGWGEDEGDAHGFHHPSLFPSPSSSFDRSSVNLGCRLGPSFSPQTSGIPCLTRSPLPSFQLHTQLSELGWASAGWDGGGARATPPSRRGDLRRAPCPRGPPFPSSLGPNLVRAPSLYKPCGGGGWAGGARGWRWQRRAGRERFILYMNDF